MLKVWRLHSAAFIVFGVLASTATASPVGPGVLSPIGLQGGATLGGSMTLNAAGNGLSDWNIVETGGLFDGFNFTPFTYTSANSIVSIFNPTFVFGGRTLTI